MRDFVRVAAAVPRVRPADVEGNIADIISLAKEASANGAKAVVFPELCVTGYTCADLFYQSSLLDAAEAALAKFLSETKTSRALFFLGVPVRLDGRLFNCAAVCQRGRLLGLVPKSYLPNTHEFYEQRWFQSAFILDMRDVDIAGQKCVPMSAKLVFADEDSGAVYGAEICEDMWAPVPPGACLAVAGANVIVNLSASNELVGKTEYRRSLVLGQSARGMCAYVYAGAGVGESTTDLVFGGHALIAENGTLLAEGPRFDPEPHIVYADVDVGFLEYDRRSNRTFSDSTVNGITRFSFASGKTQPPKNLLRKVDPHPFVPDEAADRDARCEEILAIQSAGLATRLRAIGAKDVVLGLSGGLDSALALLVCVEAFRRLGLDRKGIHLFTMPGFGTTKRTKGNAELLAEGFGIPIETIDISGTTRHHLKDIGRDESVKDITYENAQARGRTYVLMDEANKLGAIVIGTGDLSELALGWCTFNGDQMSMYGVNGGVPKTLVRYIVKWYAERSGGAVATALEDILSTPVSPELLPAKDGKISQKTEDKVGPYELHDFFLYHFIRRGAPKEKIRFLASAAFKGVYSPSVIGKWLDVFFKRFYSQQFKRSVMPDGPKVGSINLSPRGDWRMPSDAKHHD